MSTIQGRLWNSNKREGLEGLDFIHLLSGSWLSSSIRFALNNDRLHTYCAIVNDTLLRNVGTIFWFFFPSLQVQLGQHIWNSARYYW